MTDAPIGTTGTTVLPGQTQALCEADGCKRRRSLAIELAWLHGGQSHCVDVVIALEAEQASRAREVADVGNLADDSDGAGAMTSAATDQADSLSFAALLARDEIRRLLPPALLQARYGLAVHGERRRPEEAVREGDRVEILPPLVADPKDTRRQRVDARRRKQQRDRWHTG